MSRTWAKAVACIVILSSLHLLLASPPEVCTAAAAAVPVSDSPAISSDSQLGSLIPFQCGSDQQSYDALVARMSQAGGPALTCISEYIYSTGGNA